MMNALEEIDEFYRERGWIKSGEHGWLNPLYYNKDGTEKTK